MKSSFFYDGTLENLCFSVITVITFHYNLETPRKFCSLMWVYSICTFLILFHRDNKDRWVHVARLSFNQAAGDYDQEFH